VQRSLTPGTRAPTLCTDTDRVRGRP